MGIKIRNFQNNDDLQLQYQFWIERTKKLRYAWKPTTSPTLYQELKEFHPKSRAFAFEDDICVGYMSFSGKGSFVSLGYPWHLDGYEHIRDQLWDYVFGFAITDFGGKQFLQRFRGSWTKQIDYFIEKGFEIRAKQPMLVFDLNNLGPKIDHDYQIDLVQFNADKYFEVLHSNIKDHSKSPIDYNGIREYFESVQFDTTIQLSKNGEILGIIGSTDRKDNGFSDIIALTMPKENYKIFSILIAELISNLKGQKDLSITLNQAAPEIEILKNLGFEVKEHQIYVGFDQD